MCYTTRVNRGLKNMNDYTISFDNEYKGRFTDQIKEKVSTLLNSLLVFFIVLFSGLYICFFRFYYVRNWEMAVGTVLIVIGILGILITPIYSLFHKFNYGLKGHIVIDFHIENDEYYYVIKGNRKNQDFMEEGIIDLIEIKKHIIKVKTRNTKTYALPVRELSKDDLCFLKDLAIKIRNKREKETIERNKERK